MSNLVNRHEHLFSTGMVRIRRFTLTVLPSSPPIPCPRDSHTRRGEGRSNIMLQSQAVTGPASYYHGRGAASEQQAAPANAADLCRLHPGRAGGLVKRPGKGVGYEPRTTWTLISVQERTWYRTSNCHEEPHMEQFVHGET